MCGADYWHNKVIGTFFFVEQTITGPVYLGMLELYLLPKIDEIEHQTRHQIICMQHVKKLKLNVVTPHFHLG